MRQDRREPVPHHLPRAASISREPCRQPARDQHQAVGPERRRFVDRALVVVDRRKPPRGVAPRETFRRGSSPVTRIPLALDDAAPTSSSPSAATWSRQAIYRLMP